MNAKETGQQQAAERASSPTEATQEAKKRNSAILESIAAALLGLQPTPSGSGDQTRTNQGEDLKRNGGKPVPASAVKSPWSRSLSLFRSPKKAPALRQVTSTNLFEDHKRIRFDFILSNHNGDCGFESMGVTRQKGVELLLTAAKQRQDAINEAGNDKTKIETAKFQYRHLELVLNDFKEEVVSGDYNSTAASARLEQVESSDHSYKQSLFDFARTIGIFNGVHEEGHHYIDELYQRCLNEIKQKPQLCEEEANAKAFRALKVNHYKVKIAESNYKEHLLSYEVMAEYLQTKYLSHHRSAAKGYLHSGAAQCLAVLQDLPLIIWQIDGNKVTLHSCNNSYTTAGHDFEQYQADMENAYHVCVKPGMWDRLVFKGYENWLLNAELPQQSLQLQVKTHNTKDSHGLFDALDLTPEKAVALIQSGKDQQNAAVQLIYNEMLSDSKRYKKPLVVEKLIADFMGKRNAFQTLVVSIAEDQYLQPEIDTTDNECYFRIYSELLTFYNDILNSVAGRNNVEGNDIEEIYQALLAKHQDRTLVGPEFNGQLTNLHRQLFESDQALEKLMEASKQALESLYRALDDDLDDYLEHFIQRSSHEAITSFRPSLALARCLGALNPIPAVIWENEGEKLAINIKSKVLYRVATEHLNQPDTIHLYADKGNYHRLELKVLSSKPDSIYGDWSSMKKVLASEQRTAPAPTGTDEEDQVKSDTNSREEKSVVVGKAEEHKPSL